MTRPNRIARLNPSLVRAACKRTGFALTTHRTFCGDRRCACPIGVVALAEGMSPDHGGLIRLPAALAFLGLGHDYGMAFAASFTSGISYPDTIGNRDGIEVRNALLLEFGEASPG